MYQDAAKIFVEDLRGQHVPIGLAFVEELPGNIEQNRRPVPSACTFWRLAESGVFYATAEDHQECPIGLMTMGFALPAQAQERAQALVQTMANVHYFSPAEVSALPVVQKPHAAVVYGRLDQFPLEADVVLCIIDAQQAMLVAEALGQVNWLQGGQAAFGRPTCGVIPRTLNTNQSSMSFGCIGARTYLELGPGEIVLTVTARRFAELVEKLHTIVVANAALAPYHQQQKASFGV